MGGNTPQSPINTTTTVDPQANDSESDDLPF